jgi:UDP-GlcNAc:undecaprenyl-phosphate GlcNAc-1-phosphate transferase
MWQYMSTGYSAEKLLIATIGAFVVALVMTPIVRELAKRKSLLDQPNHRSSHSIPVPRLGGVALVPATLLGVALLIDEVDWRIAALAVGALVMAGTGFFDDLKSISALQKYAPQLLAAGLAAWALQPDFHIELPFVHVHVTGVMAALVAAFWITAFINAYNFMDGIDGMAGGVGMITAIGLIMLTSGNALFMVVPLAASLAGFLAWNANPASIFMGDGGSQFVGFILAVGALYWPSFDVGAVPLLIVFAPFIFDTGFTLVWRAWNRMNIFRAHRTHLYQRLTALGFSHRGVANLYWGATGACLMLAAGYQATGPFGQVVILAVLILAAFSYASLVSGAERGVKLWTEPLRVFASDRGSSSTRSMPNHALLNRKIAYKKEGRFE